MGVVILISMACLIFLLTLSGYAVTAVRDAEATLPGREDVP